MILRTLLFLSRTSVLQPENVFAGDRKDDRLGGFQFHAHPIAATFQALLLPGSFDEDPPHGLGGGREEVAKAGFAGEGQLTRFTAIDATVLDAQPQSIDAPH